MTAMSVPTSPVAVAWSRVAAASWAIAVDALVLGGSVTVMATEADEVAAPRSSYATARTWLVPRGSTVTNAEGWDPGTARTANSAPPLGGSTKN